MTTVVYIFGATILVSLISFIGVLTLTVKPAKMEKITILLISLSAGTLLGDSFLHLIPETIESLSSSLSVWLWLLGGIMTFFILEKIVCWRHCHIPTTKDHPHPFGTMNLIGDGLHNLIDGIIIAGSFLVSIPLGVATTLAIIAHEIPQEISDFGVLIHAGYPRAKALMLNFLSAMISILGAIITLIIGTQMNGFITYILPFTAGGFIYIATADLIPELHKETQPKESLKQLITILIGIGIMWAMKIWLA